MQDVCNDLEKNGKEKMNHSLNSQNQMAQAKNWEIVHPTRLATFLKIEFKIRQALYNAEPAQRPAPTAFSPNTLC